MGLDLGLIYTEKRSEVTVQIQMGRLQMGFVALAVAFTHKSSPKYTLKTWMMDRQMPLNILSHYNTVDDDIRN